MLLPTLGIGCLSQKKTRVFAEHDGSIGRRDVGNTMPEESLKLVNVVGAFSAASRMLAVNGVHPQPARTHAEDERILSRKVSLFDQHFGMRRLCL
jgi:hypothetical protein